MPTRISIPSESSISEINNKYASQLKTLRDAQKRLQTQMIRNSKRIRTLLAQRTKELAGIRQSKI